MTSSLFFHAKYTDIRIRLELIISWLRYYPLQAANQQSPPVRVDNHAVKSGELWSKKETRLATGLMRFPLPHRQPANT